MLEDKETKPANKMPLYCSSNSWENACQTPMPHSWEAVLPWARQNNTVTNKILNADEGFRGTCCLLYLMLGLNCPRTAKPLPGGYATESWCSRNQKIRGCDLSLAFSAHRTLQAAISPPYLHWENHPHRICQGINSKSVKQSRHNSLKPDGQLYSPGIWESLPQTTFV